MRIVADGVTVRAWTARPLLAFACLSLLASTVLAQDWPQWRGKGSSGVGVVSSTPERWSHIEGVRWRAVIEGYGISSPVIVGSRVYVTTALTAQQRTALRLACDTLVGGLAVLGIPLLVRCRWRQIPGLLDSPRQFTSRVFEWLDTALFMMLAGTVLVFGVLVAIGPNAIDVGLETVRDAGVISARWLGRYRTNLWFFNWDEANRHNTWIISSSVALASLALIPFLFAPRSSIRVVSSVALLGGVWVAVELVPWASAYGSRFPIGALVSFYSPVVIIAGWHLLCNRVSHRNVGKGATTTLLSAGVVSPLLSLAMLVSPNYLNQQDVVTRRIVCLDAVNGVTLWQSDLFSTPAETRAAANSDATPTPLVADGVVVAAFGPGIAAVDLEGALLWSRLFPRWIENSIYGAGSSPTTDGKAVFVTVDREYAAQQQSRVVAYSLSTGQEIWSNTPEFAHDGYATPVAVDDGNRKLLLTLTSRALVAYDIADGSLAWQMKTPVSQPVPSLIAENEHVYVTGGIGGGGYTAAYRLEPNASPDELWRSEERADVSSPVLHRGKLFTISSTGIMVCYEARSGNVLWRQRIGSGLGAFYASLVAADDKVYAVRSNGTTYVIAAEDKFRMISVSSLAEDMYASPAFGGNCLLLRTVSAVYCIGTKRGT